MQSYRNQNDVWGKPAGVMGLYSNQEFNFFYMDTIYMAGAEL